MPNPVQSVPSKHRAAFEVHFTSWEVKEAATVTCSWVGQPTRHVDSDDSHRLAILSRRCGAASVVADV
ncbi:hypothetical protein CRG98_044256 [Punica granatum]|uniref:Uncharacterized protein n=1 Tax=Punica granatum TaxID=22663 RepID=A0A2I0HUF7_PUNGR|nr:hypothetical protein CRG98_044256 [Punica granatum]